MEDKWGQKDPLTGLWQGVVAQVYNMEDKWGQKDPLTGLWNGVIAQVYTVGWSVEFFFDRTEQVK